MAKSLNTVAWQVYEQVTPKVGLQYLKNMNFSSIVKDDYTLATSLGGFTKGVSPLEMASAYTALENDGMFRQPNCIKSIVDADENIVYSSQMTEVSIYEQDAARTMTDVLTTVMDSGTGRALKLSNMPCAGKTGTTNDHKDGWFVGYTRYYTTSVWVGCDYPKSISNLSGSTYPGQIWKAYMSAIHENLDPMDFLPYAKLSDEFIQKEQEEESQKEQEREDQKDSEAEKDSEADQKDSEKDETKKEPADTNTSDKNNNSEDTNASDDSQNNDQNNNQDNNQDNDNSDSNNSGDDQDNTGGDDTSGDTGGDSGENTGE